jgi:hypothetical protein
MKYPHTLHLPWSEGLSRGDKRLDDVSAFEVKTLIYTEKLDGENTCFSKDFIHARSPNGYAHKWQGPCRGFWYSIKDRLPDDIVFYAENLYPVHSIEYEDLPSHLFLFNVKKDDRFLSWPEVVYWSRVLSIPLVPFIHQGEIQRLPLPSRSAFGSVCEGYVVRNADSFIDFTDNVAKCVRKDHVQTDEHWTRNWRPARLGDGSMTFRGQVNQD